jgi:hypothetical protein
VFFPQKSVELSFHPWSFFKTPTSHRPLQRWNITKFTSSIIFDLHAINMGTHSPLSRHFRRRQQHFKISIEQRCSSELMRFLILNTTMLARLSASHMCGISLYSIKHPKQNPDYFQPLLVSECSKSRSDCKHGCHCPSCHEPDKGRPA